MAKKVSKSESYVIVQARHHSDNKKQAKNTATGGADQGGGKRNTTTKKEPTNGATGSSDQTGSMANDNRDSMQARCEEKDTVGPIEGVIRFSERKSIPIIIHNFGAQSDTIEAPNIRLHGLEWRVRVRKDQGDYIKKLGFDVACLSTTTTIKADFDYDYSHKNCQLVCIHQKWSTYNTGDFVELRG